MPHRTPPCPRRRARKPDPEPRPPARLRCEFPESPTSPYPREFHPAQCGRVCASWFAPPAERRTEVGGRAAPPPECSDSCCRSLRSISWSLSLVTGSQDFDFRKLRVFVIVLRQRKPRTASLFSHAIQAGG